MKSFDARLLTGAQLRAARALIGISAEELAQAAQLGVATIRRAEQLDGPVAMTLANASAAVVALEAAGVVFIGDGQQGLGVKKAPAN